MTGRQGNGRVAIARAVALAGLTAFALAASAVSAGAATPVGQLAEPSETNNCPPHTALLTQSVSSGRGFVVPAGGGVITSWTTRTDASNIGTTAKLKVYRATSDPDQFLVVGQSDYRAFSSAGVQGPFPVRISVQEGDWVSILPGDNGGPCLANTGDPADASRVTQGQGDTPTGGTTLFFACCNTTQHANVEALLEPDADNDGFGDETQDECPTDASTQGACPVGKANRAIRLDANKHHAHRGDRIKLVGRIESSDQAACADGQTVQLQRERRRSKTWKAIGSATSDASGVFELRYKLKRNRRYHFRAVLTETAACGEGVSNEDHVHADRDHR